MVLSWNDFHMKLKLSHNDDTTFTVSSQHVHNHMKTRLKGPVKLIKRVKIAHSYLQCVKSVPRYHFKLDVNLQMAVKEFF